MATSKTREERFEEMVERIKACVVEIIEEDDDGSNDYEDSDLLSSAVLFNLVLLATSTQNPRQAIMEWIHTLLRLFEAQIGTDSDGASV